MNVPATAQAAPTPVPAAAAPEPYPRFRETRFFGSLDGLRALSIVPVVWHHASARHGYVGLLGAGHLGVQLFFAISGFLITTLLLREKERTGTVSLPRFYARRSLRIFPLYYATLAIYTALVLAFMRGDEAGAQFLRHLPAFATYTSNWFVDLLQGDRVVFYFAWSLATEEQFYLFWPSVVRFARRWWSPAAIMVALLVASEWARTLGPSHGLPARILSSVASPICFGCIGAILLDRRRVFPLLYGVLGQLWSAPVAGLLLLGAVAADAPPLLCTLAMAVLVVACVIRPDHGLARLLDLAPLRYVGTVSYGVYLLHMLALNAARKAVGFVLPPGADGLGPPAPAVFAVGLALSIALAAISHRYFEARFLRLKDRFG